jgi:hypothetical protein
VDEDSASVGSRELRRSRTASRILPAEFTVEDTKTYVHGGPVNDGPVSRQQSREEKKEPERIKESDRTRA